MKKLSEANKEELKKCKDLVYFYNNYVRPKYGRKLTQEKYEELLRVRRKKIFDRFLGHTNYDKLYEKLPEFLKQRT